MSAALPPDAERFLLALAAADTHAWVQAARAYAAARRALPFIEARAVLAWAAREAASDPGSAAVSVEIARRVRDAARALRPVIVRRDVLATMERSALRAPYALALRDCLVRDVVALLTAPYRDLLDRRTLALG